MATGICAIFSLVFLSQTAHIPREKNNICPPWTNSPPWGCSFEPSGRSHNVYKYVLLGLVLLGLVFEQ